jgi:hypothetical protein
VPAQKVFEEALNAIKLLVLLHKFDLLFGLAQTILDWHKAYFNSRFFFTALIQIKSAASDYDVVEKKFFSLYFGSRMERGVF